jgi:hypothetical protein
MRGGAIPLLVWALLNLILLVIDWIWQGTQIGVALTGYTVLIVNLFAFVYWLMNRAAVRKGEPTHDGEPQALPRISLPAALIGISVGVILYGVVFGKFMVFIGIALLALALGGVGRELIWQQRTLSSVRRERRGAGSQ